MKWIFYNPNPYGNNTGDCVIRALTLAFGKNWDDVYNVVPTKARSSCYVEY